MPIHHQTRLILAVVLVVVIVLLVLQVAVHLDEAILIGKIMLELDNLRGRRADVFSNFSSRGLANILKMLEH